RLVGLWSARKSGAAGSKLHVRLTTLFSLVAIVPTVIVVVFSALFFDLGLQNWFSEKVKTAINNSVSVAEAYLEEHKKSIPRDLAEMAAVLNRKAPYLQFNQDAFSDEVLREATMRSFAEAIVITSSGDIVVRHTLGLSKDDQAALSALPRGALEQADSGLVVPLVGENDDRVRALIRLDGYFDRYLYTSRLIDPRVMAQLEQTREEAAAYVALEDERSSIQLNFNLVFVAIALLILLAAVWMGLWLATQLVAPVSGLVQAAEEVRRGNLRARVPEPESDDEISMLSRAFNRMTDQLEEQRSELVNANTQLDNRRRFTEAVLAGVSVGVMGLKADGTVDLPNRAALTILEIEEGALVGHDLTQVLPEISDILSRARKTPNQLVQEHINIVRSGKAKTLFVRVSFEKAGDLQAGFVVTLDDISKLVAAERTAAWADVARRIAHEIKNPLTPIQLSAERLRRKYAGEIHSDIQTFEQCTDTIIRQVGDIRRMVDEFSGFARMPAPTFRQESINSLIRQTLLFLEVSSPEIEFSFNAPDEDVVLLCDGRQIAQALTNVIKNAAESIEARRRKEGAGASKGQIGISLSHDADFTRISITDNGLGLPPDLRDRLTEPYVTTREKGTGLGLAIVKKIMSDHGGELVLGDRGEGGVEAHLIFSHTHLRQLQESPARDDDDRKESVG
ncbi:MAG: PAS domain-containing sensor histidine kinase, partial [Alphaproteobacteria bacterium]|nr:PAS domain-containing sensor histidine kinase [Alphaproteobacteria bacterium]